jgi:hypothetical protein
VPKGNGAPRLIRPFSLYSGHFWGAIGGAKGRRSALRWCPPTLNACAVASRRFGVAVSAGRASSGRPAGRRAPVRAGGGSRRAQARPFTGCARAVAFRSPDPGPR